MFGFILKLHSTHPNTQGSTGVSHSLLPFQEEMSPVHYLYRAAGMA